MSTIQKKGWRVWQVSLAALALGASMLVTPVAQAATCPSETYDASKPYPQNCFANYQGKRYQAKWWAETPPAVDEKEPWNTPWKLVADGPTIPGVPALSTKSGDVKTGDPVNVAWTMSGTPGTQWQVLDGASSIFQSTSFTTSTPTTQAANTSLTLAKGSHSLAVKLCNATGCSTSSAVTINVKDPVDPSKDVPGVPAISTPAGEITEGTKLSFAWSMSGVNGTAWDVMNNGTSLYHSTSFDSQTANAQSAKTNLTLAVGSYNLTVKLCNANGCSTSSPIAITVKKNDPTPAKDAPGAARVNWMNNTVASGQSFNFAWTLDWGVTGTSWEVIANGTSVYNSTTFASTTPTSQTGNTTLKLADGQYNLAVKLCNAAGCTTGTAFALTVGADKSKTPTAPQAAEIGNLKRGQAAIVSWNMYWGDVGSSWQVLVDSQNVYTSQQFTRNEANVQAGQVSLDFTPLKLTDGKHTLVVKLCNDALCSQDSKSFTIGGDVPAPAPSKPVIAAIPDSTTKQVVLNWSQLAATDVQGASWSVLDNFQGTTSTIYPSTTVFGSDSGKQTGTANLTLNNGTHQLTVRLCNAAAVCTDSDVATAKVTLPPQPAPGTPTMSNIPDSTEGKLAINWTMTGTPGAYWEVWNGATKMRTFSDFTQQAPNAQAGSETFSVNNGTYTVSVKLCNSDNVCSISNVQTVHVSGAPDKRAFFMGYYPTWYEPSFNAFCDQSGQYKDFKTKTWKTCVPGNKLADTDIQDRALLAGGIPDYVTHVMLSFGKLNLMHNWLNETVSDKLNLNRSTVGLDFTSSSKSVKEAIRVLKETHPGTKVILALGGATFNDSWSGVTDDDIRGLTKLLVDLDIDGLDVDYEVMGTTPAIINQYYDSIAAMRKAVDAAKAQSGKDKILTLAAWSTGADCTAETKSYAQCAGKVSYWGGGAGRELQVLQGKGAAAMIDVIGIMAYDASYKSYDPVVAYQQYRAIARPDAQVAIGIEPAPQAWGGAVTTVDAKYASTCVGNLIEKDQYQNPVNTSATVKRLADALQPGDGLMLWSLFLEDKDRNLPNRDAAPCGNSGVTNIARNVSELLGIGSDRTTEIDWKVAICYLSENRAACVKG